MGGIGVLVFVYQHMAHHALPTLAHRLVLLQQLQRQANQIIKIDTLVGRQAGLVLRHHPSDLALVLVLGRQRGALGVEPHVLPQADGPLPLPRGGGVNRTAGVLQNAGNIVAVQNRELGLETQRLAILAQHAHPERVKSADQHLFGRPSNQAFATFAHFGRSLVGEGDGGDAPRLQAALNEAGDLVRDDAGFASARASQHQAGAVHEIHGLLLSQVQAGGRRVWRWGHTGAAGNAHRLAGGALLQRPLKG